MKPEPLLWRAGMRGVASLGIKGEEAIAINAKTISIK